MKELINHFVFDTVSLQIVAVILLGFWFANRKLPTTGDLDTPRDYFGHAGTLALALFVAVSVTARYYGAPWLMVGKIALWALHVGVLMALRWRFTSRNRPSLWAFLGEFARFEAIASLGVLFLK